MTAKILKFAPCGSVPVIAMERGDMPPHPILKKLTYFGSEKRPDLCEFIGSRESLIAWRVTTEAEFPEGRKKRQYNGPGRPCVEKSVRGDELFVATFFFGRDVSDEAVRCIQEVIDDIREASSRCEIEAEKRISGLFSLRQSLFFPADGQYSGVDYDRAQLAAFDELTADIERVVAAVLTRSIGSAV